MNVNKGNFALWCFAVGSEVAFSGQALSTTRLGFVGQRQGAAFNTQQRSRASAHLKTSSHSAGCGCTSCAGSRRGTPLFADVAENSEVPLEVAAMDGVESSEEAHNISRPARQQIKKNKPKEGKSLTEFEEGQTVTGTVKSLAPYGAFVDIGATTDGLLHVSQLSIEFVSDVSDIVKEGQEVQVRIVKIDSAKGQIGLSMITAEEEAEANESAKKKRESRQASGNRRQNNRRDDSAVLGALTKKGWDDKVMVPGVVVSTTDFGAFVKVDASKLNNEVDGEFDGLVHISALKIGRVSSVGDVVNPNDKVQVRCKNIDGNKVSLTMLSVEDEESKNSERGGGGGFMDDVDMGAKDWAESLAKFDEEQPAFSNTAVIIQRSK